MDAGTANEVPPKLEEGRPSLAGEVVLDVITLLLLQFVVTLPLWSSWLYGRGRRAPTRGLKRSC